MCFSKLFQLLRLEPRRQFPPVELENILTVPARDATLGLRHLSRLDVEHAITTHLEWRLRLNEWLSQDEVPPASGWPSAEQAGLGLWLMRVRQYQNCQPSTLTELETEYHLLHGLSVQALHHAHQDRVGLASTLLNTRFERSHRRLMHLLHSLRDS